MILAGDVGGTKTLIGLFELGAPRPVPIDVRAFATTTYRGLPHIIDEFLSSRGERPRLDAAAFGVAGPVIDQAATLTNVSWRVDAAELSDWFAVPHVRLLNDLEAMAHSVPVLETRELRVLQAGRRTEGNIALIAAGTGLGEAVLHRVDGLFAPLASEGGHSDYAARSDRELELLRFLRARYGRAEVEHVLSGPGLVNLSDFTHQDGPCGVVMRDGDPAEWPAAVSRSALAGTCSRCVEALELFVASYGAAAGNLALTAMTTGGVFVGGGIAPRILPALESRTFVEAFNAKDPMRPLLEAIPVQVILNAESALLGAAVCAAGLIEARGR